MIIASKVKEELEEGKKWFNLIAQLTLLVIIIMLFRFNFEFFIALFIGLILNYFIKKIYLFLGLVLALVDDKLLFSVIIFIFGLAYGTLEYIKFKKINYKITIMNFILFFIPIILLFNKYTMIYNNVLTGFAIGGIIIGLLRINTGFKKKKRTKRS